jgi:hypothetical protein
LLSYEARAKSLVPVPRVGINATFNPRWRAAVMPGASALLEITTAISASNFPAAIESAIAAKFEPRPDNKTPSRFFTG